MYRKCYWEIWHLFFLFFFMQYQVYGHTNKVKWNFYVCIKQRGSYALPLTPNSILFAISGSFVNKIFFWQYLYWCTTVKILVTTWIHVHMQYIDMKLVLIYAQFKCFAGTWTNKTCLFDVQKCFPQSFPPKGN